MASPVLLVSNPPHPKVDAPIAASVLGISPIDANLKIRYGVPEIWVADADRALVEAAAARLKEAGMRCVTLDGEQFAGVPPQQLVRGFVFSERGIVLNADEGGRELAYNEPMIVVPASPRPAEGAPSGTRITVAPWVQVLDISPFIDVYLPDGKRFAIYGELVDFAGLGTDVAPNQQRNMLQLGQLMRERLKRARFDDRLIKMQLRRPRQTLPPQLRESRRGYSFASPGLDALLTVISPELHDLTQSELSSRLAFLTTLAAMLD